MDNFAKSITSIAALISAAAWPAAILIIVFAFRRDIRKVVERLPSAMDRIKKATAPGFSVELEEIVRASTTGATSDAKGEITPAQVIAAARIKMEARTTDMQTLASAMDALCLEYDSLRRTLPSGPSRTGAMTRVLVKMRALAPSVANDLDAYRGSSSPGSRLAAVAIMQMVPNLVQLDWLVERFAVDQPFIFYHSALAMQSFANIVTSAGAKADLVKATEQALKTVKSFVGNPDQDTIFVLEHLREDLSVI